MVGRAYWLKLGTQMVSVTVAEPKYEINVNTMEHLAAKTLELNSIGVAEISTDRRITFDPYSENRALGGFILIDKITNHTVGAGMLHFSLRRFLPARLSVGGKVLQLLGRAVGNVELT